MFARPKLIRAALIFCAFSIATLTVVFLPSSAAAFSNAPNHGPIVLFKPFYAPPGSIVQVTGKNFVSPSGTAFTLQLCGYSCSVVYKGTLSSGGFLFDYKVPLSTSVGAHNMMANDSNHELATNILNVISKITIRPVNGPVGRIIGVSGVGFAPSTSVKVSFGTETNIVATQVSNASGAFFASFTVKANPSGSYVVNASDGFACFYTGVVRDYEHCSVAYYKILPFLSPGTHSVHPGSSLSLTGTGWAASTRVNFTLSNGANLGYAASSTLGSFSTSVTIPLSTPAATYTLTAKDSSGDLRQITFTVP